MWLFVFLHHAHAISHIAFRYSHTRTTMESGDDEAPKQTPTPAAPSDTHNEWITSPCGKKECNPPNKDVVTMAQWDNMLFSRLHMPLIHSVLHSLTVTRSAENKLVPFPPTARLRRWRQGRFATTIMSKIWNTQCNCSLLFSSVVVEFNTELCISCGYQAKLEKGLVWYLIKSKCCISAFYILFYLSSFFCSTVLPVFFLYSE